MRDRRLGNATFKRAPGLRLLGLARVFVRLRIRAELPWHYEVQMPVRCQTFGHILSRHLRIELPSVMPLKVHQQRLIRNPDDFVRVKHRQRKLQQHHPQAQRAGDASRSCRSINTVSKYGT